MAVSVTINGSSYTFPATGDENWGDQVTQWAQAVSLHLLQKTGGTFTLTNDVNFGPSFGLKSLYYKTLAANVSNTGAMRLGNSEGFGWRNNANSADLLLSVDSSNILNFNGSPVAISIGAANTVYVSNGTSPTWALLVNANISASAAIAYSKLNLTGLIVNADIGAAAAIAFTKLAALTSTNILVGNGSNVATAVAVSGDATLANTGALTIAAGAVTLAKQANLAANSIIGNNTGSAAVPLALTAAQVRTLLGIAAPTVQTFLSGSGTYTTPANVLYLHVRLIGGGGGGGGSSNTGGTGGTGGNTTFGTTLLVGNGGPGGSGGVAAGTNQALGGTASLGAALGIAIQGGRGGNGGFNTTAQAHTGGMGASTPFGGGGGTGVNSAGTAPVANTGAGGGGGGTGSTISNWAGNGGSAGGFVDAIITSPGATYAYAVGAAGTAGTAGTMSAGSAGASGLIIVDEFY